MRLFKSKKSKKTLRQRQMEFFKNKGMTLPESLRFCSYHGKCFEPNDFKDYHPEGKIE